MINPHECLPPAPRSWSVGSWLLPGLLALGLAGPAGAQPADGPVVVENIRVGLENTSKVGVWTPVWVDLSSPAGRFRGTLEVEVPDEDGVPTRFQQPVSVDAGGGLSTAVAYVRPGLLAADVAVRLRDEAGRPVSRPVRPEDLPGGLLPILLAPTQTMLVSLGNPSGIAEVAALVGASAADEVGLDTELVVVRPRVPGGLPGRWYGYDAADVVVLDTNDQSVLEDLRGRGEGLRQWVHNGGHLVVAGVANWQVVREQLGDLLPAVPTGTVRLTDSGEIETFAGTSTNPLLALGDSMSVARLEPDERRGVRVLAATAETPLILRGAHGFGRVTVIGFDVDAGPFAEWKDRVLFWARALDLRLDTAAEGATLAVPGGGGGAFFRERSSALSSLLHRALDRPEGVTLVPFGWVAVFVFIYILLIGPGDYFFLKRVLRRMELTWITFPAIVVVVSALAYVAAYRLKGTELKITKLDIVDVDGLTGQSRGASWMTLFSPENQDYDLTVVPLPPGGSAPAGDAGAERPAVVPGTERLVSWFGPADPRLGGGGGGGLTLAGSGYLYGPPGEVESLRGVRIPIWSTKSFGARWTMPSVAEVPIEADLEVVGTDRVVGTITNRSARPLHEAVLCFGTQVYDQLGTIAPGAAVRIDLASRTRPLRGYLDERAGMFLTDEGGYFRPDDEAQARLALADVARVAMFRGGMASKAVAPPVTALSGLDLSGLLPLGRPMLVARVDGPLAELALDGATSPPRLDQTSLLRVVLPTGGPESPGAVDSPRPVALRDEQ